MPRNSSGTYSLPAGNPVVTNTLIQSTWANTTLSDVSTAMTDSLDRNGRGAMLAPLKNVDGTAVAPSITFSSEGTLGIYRVSAGVMGFSVGGALILSLTGTGLTFNTPVAFPGGSATVPSITWIANTNTGLYQPSTNQVGITTNGAQRLNVDATGEVNVLTGNLNIAAFNLNLAAGGASVVFQGVGIGTIAATNAGGSLQFQTGGANTRMSISTSGFINFATAATFNSTVSHVGVVTFENNVALDWKDNGGTARRILNVLTTPNIYVGDMDNAIANSVLHFAAVSSAEFDINGSKIASVTTSGFGVGVTPTTSLQIQKTTPAASPTWNAVDAVIVSATGTSAMQMHAGANVGNLAYAFAVGTTRSIGGMTYATATDALSFSSASTNRLTLDSAGNSFFGTGAPSAWASGWNAIELRSSGVGMHTNGPNRCAISENYIESATGSVYATTNLAASFDVVSGAFQWNTAPSGTGGTAITFTQVMSLSNTGNLTVTGTITAPTFSGNVTGSSGSTTGNAATATALQTARLIGGVSFNGTANITPTTVASGATDGTFELGWKDIPQNTQTAAYTLVLADRGKSITITTGGVTIPSGIFSAGNVGTIANNSATAQTITQGASTTVHQAGTTNTGNRSLLPWGIATWMCIASNVFIITGNIT